MGVYSKKRLDGTKAWYYNFMYNRVRYRGVGGTTRTQALRTQDKVRGEVISGCFNLPRKVGSIHIEKFAKKYLARRQHLKSRRSDNLSTQTLLRFFKGKPLSTINPSDIEDYISFRRTEGVSNATINRELACLKKMYNLAIDWEDATKNPVLRVKLLKEPPGRTRFLSIEEAKKLIESCANHLRPIVITALNNRYAIK